MVHLYDYVGGFASDANIWFSLDGRYQFWSESSSASNFYWTSLSQRRGGMNADWISQAIDPRLDAALVYVPLADSPAIDRGIRTGYVTADYAGTARPQGAAFDIGAYERVISTEPPPVEPPPVEPPPVEPPPPPVIAPAAPTSLSAVQGSRTAVALTWSDTSNNEDGFRVERSVDGGAFTVIATLGAGSQSYTVNGVKRNKTYTFRVAAYNAAGSSPYSNSASVTISR